MTQRVFLKKFMRYLNLTIRSMKYEDLSEIAQIYKQANPFASKEEIKEWTKKNLKFHANLCYVALNEKKIIGGISGHKKNGIVIIDDIAVREGYQHRGVGSKLIEKVFSTCRNGDVKEVRGEVHYKCASSIAFGYKHGFRVLECKRDHFGEGEDAIILIKRYSTIKKTEK